MNCAAVQGRGTETPDDLFDEDATPVAYRADPDKVRARLHNAWPNEPDRDATEESRSSLLALYLPPPLLACCGRQPLRRFSIILTTDVIASDSAENTTTPAKTISTW
jgi:hypothetical protein